MLLHYIYDPFCGWCYGAAPLVAAARAVLSVRAHGGGMMTGGQRQMGSAALRAYVLPHVRRISGLTGQAFGAAYVDELLVDATAEFDSAPPISAVLAADAVAGRGLDLLAAMQNAHYGDGRAIARADVLLALARTIGIDGAQFADAYARVVGEATAAHLAQSRALLARVGGRGFPTFALEHENRILHVDPTPYYGRPGEWQTLLAGKLGTAPSAPLAGVDRAAACAIDGCAG